MAEPTKPATTPPADAAPAEAPPKAKGPKVKGPKAMTKSAVFKELAEKCELTQKQIAEIFEALTALIKAQLGKKGPGVFVLPGLLKIKKVEKKATPERMGVKPGTTEPMLFKAKPARRVIKAQPLKGLKEMAK
jgi:nucleoid DNA-binding protein